MANAKKAKAVKTGAVVGGGRAAQNWPVFIDVPGQPDKVERCDWDAANNQPNCQIIDRVPNKGVRVRAAGPIRGVHKQHRAKRR
jgi:hypothetical protein